MRVPLLVGSSLAALCAVLGSVTDVHAQTATSEAPSRAVEVDEVIVTGLKRSVGVTVQDAPVTVSAFGEEQLEEIQLRDMAELDTVVPNVNFSNVSVFPGSNNFAIRGMGVYGSTPGATPTVGIFVDEVFQGSVTGAVLSTFDIAGIEVLRGPQGLLFGRNVTAGAILMRTSAPTSSLSIKASASMETGPQYETSLIVSGPLASFANGKIALYRDKDQGWFRNDFMDGAPVGKSDTNIVRAAIALWPGRDFTTTLRVERGNVEGDGGVFINQRAVGRHSFTVNIDERGYINSRWDQVNMDTRWNVGFGDGQIVNIAAFRGYRLRGFGDDDGTPFTNLHIGSWHDYEQISEELRYSGTFGIVDLTVGYFYFSDRLQTVSHRTIQNGARKQSGGALQNSSQWAVFSNFDIALPADFTLNLGARYSAEEKRVGVQTELIDAVSPCNKDTGVCTSFDFTDSHEWDAFTPLVGLQWNPGPDTNVYSYWTKGFRSGGYNLRRTSPTANPGPFEQEVENTIELGVKQRFLDARVRTSLAVFQNKYENLQRDVLRQDPLFGTITLSSNAADVTIRGVEGELTASVVRGLDVGLNFGYLESKFDQVKFDLTGNGSIGPEDYALELPYLLPWTFGANVRYEWSTPVADFAASTNFNWRDQGFSNDANTGVLPVVRALAANLSISPAMWRGVTFALYGKNLLDQPTWGFSNPSTFANTGPVTLTPMNEGRVVGLEIRYEY